MRYRPNAQPPEENKHGYFEMKVDEILGGRYELKSTLGRGVFSTVFEARDLDANPPHTVARLRRHA